MCAAGQVTIRVLGPLQIDTPDGPYELTSRRQRALLAALAVRSGRPVTVSDLIDAVWDDEPPEEARATLQTYVSRARRVLGQTVIRHTPAGYQLDPSVTTDVGEARAGVRRLDGLDRGDHRARADLALDILAWWRGPALAEFADVDWFRPHVVELTEMHLNLTDVAAEGLIHSSRAVHAVSLLEVSLADDSLREPTHVLLVRALHAAGRTADAMRAAARFRRRLRDETGLVPSRALSDVEQMVLAVEPPRELAAATASPEMPGALASWSSAPLARPTPLIGRDRELDEVHHQLTASRLVTVTGVGGVGKSRLVAELIQRRDISNALVVNLTPVTAGNVAAAVGAAAGIRSRQPSVSAVVDALRDVDWLLVLDNGEHVADEARELVRSTLDTCPRVRILMTSRLRLDLPDEIAITLEPLRVDGPGSDAVGLFVDRLARARPGDDIDRSDPAIAELCRRLDGVPLALELAASRAAALGVSTLLDRFESMLGSFVEVDRERGRHATLGNVVAWSVELLGDPARKLLGALSVFRGEFDLEAAEAVGRAAVDESVPLLLGRLVDTSLVMPGVRPDRYRLLEMIRTFGADALERSERLDAVQQAHATWAGRRLAEIEVRSVGPGEKPTLAHLDEIRHEVIAALQWAVTSGDAGVAARIVAPLAGLALYRPDIDLVRRIHWVSQQRLGIGSGDGSTILAAGARAAFLLGDLDAVDQLATKAKESAADSATRHRACHALGVVRLYQGRFSEACDCFERVADDPGAAIVDRLDALGGLALARCFLAALDEAAAVAAEHRALSDTLGSDTYRAFADYVLAEIELAAGNVDAAADLLADAANRAWDVGAEFVWGIASTVLASVLVRHRPPAEARAVLPTLLDRWRRTATWPQLWTTLRIVAEHLVAAGEPGTALLILESADRDPAAPTLAGDDHGRYAGLRSQLRAEIGDSAASGIEHGAAALDRTAVVAKAMAILAEPIRQ